MFLVVSLCSGRDLNICQCGYQTNSGFCREPAATVYQDEVPIRVVDSDCNRLCRI